MKSTELVTEQLFNELMDVFFDKFIFYAPREVLTEKVIESLDDDYDGRLFDTFLYTDNELGISGFDNEDALELNTFISKKRALLQQNTFKLLDKSKELTEIEFLVVVEKYYEFLMLFIHISDWMCVNLKKYNGTDIHLGIIGAFSIQLNFFVSHLKDICNYFGAFLDLDLEFDFSKYNLAFRYLPEIVSRYTIATTTDDVEKIDTEQEKVKKTAKSSKNDSNKKKSPRKKKEKPLLDEKKIENMILNQMFNIDNQVLQQKELN